MTVAESNFKVGDALKIKDSAWEGSYSELNRFGFQRHVSYEVSGVFPSGISLVGNTCIYYPRYFELSKNSTVYAKYDELKVKAEDPEYTGGSSNYYKVFIQHPTTLDAPYEAECNDIIEALKMTFAEGNAFKAIWRKAKARQGVQKKGYDNGLYDSEKVVFFGERMVVEAKSETE